MEKKRKWLLQNVLVCSLPIVLLIVGMLFCCRHRSFSIEKISSKLSYNDRWDTGPLSQESEDFLKTRVFNQVYYILGSGQECYAFASEDDLYVLKFFKMHHLLPKNWLNDFPFSLFENYRFNNIEKRQYLLEKTFFSFKNAFDFLRKESAIVYAHLNKTHHLKQKVTLIDREGRKNVVDLDSKEFVVQRKASRAQPYLLDLMSRDEEESARRCVRSFLEIIATRCQKGLADRDGGVHNKYGFIGEQAVLIDCGELVPDLSLTYPHNYQKEILRMAETLDEWAQNYCPELSAIIQQEAQRLISASHEGG